MKAGVLYDNNDLRCDDIALPVIGQNDVLVKLAYCGICGSDLPRVFQGMSKHYPNVLGHEFSGTIEEVGSMVASCKPGDHVVGIPLVPCGKCKSCCVGNFALCEDYDFIGSRRFGAFAQYIAIPASNVLSIDQNIDLRTASFFEPAAVAMHAINLMGALSDKRIAIVGGGTIGLLLAQIVRHEGASEVVVFGHRDERLDIAHSVGIKQTVNTSDSAWREKLAQVYGVSEFDYVFETAGTSETVHTSIDIAASRGKICLVGTPKSETVFSVSEWEQINRKELTIVGSWMSYSSPWPGVEWDEVAKLFLAKELVVSNEMIHGVYELNEIANAFGQFYPETKALGKVLIKCN